MNERKHPFLVVYDHGGGSSLWGVLDARSENEITGTYPELAVVPGKPMWMDQRRHDELFCQERHDIDEREPSGMLRALIAARKNNSASNGPGIAKW